MSTDPTLSESVPQTLPSKRDKPLIAYLVWPLLALAALFMFKPQIASLIEYRDGKEVSVGVGSSGFTVAVKSAASALIATKEATDRAGVGLPPDAAKRVAEAAASVADQTQVLKQASILWVDDKPTNNTSLINAFTDLGVGVFQAKDTAGGQNLLAKRHFDVIITDMGRPGNKTAGLDILADPKASNIPTIIYSASWSGDHLGQENEFKVAKITNDPSEVYQSVLSLLLKK